MKALSLARTDIDFVYPTASLLKRIFLPLIDPAIRAALLVRFAQCAPRYSFWIYRNLLVSLHGIDVGRGFRIGPSVSFPHPIGIVIGGGVIIGEQCRVFQNVTLGRTEAGYPHIGDRVIIYPNCVLVGNIEIQNGRSIRACSFLTPSRN